MFTLKPQQITCYPRQAIAVFRFDKASGSIALDCSGHLRTGLLIDCQRTSGKHGSALVLSGKSLMVINPDRAFISDAFTVSFWIWIDSSTNSSIITKKESGVSIPGGYSIDISDNHIRFLTSFGEAGGIATVKSDSAASLMAKQWTHVAAIFSKGKSQQLYINGIKQEDSTYNSIRLNDTPIIIGNGFVEKIDDIKIHSRVIGEKEIERLISEDGF